MPPDPRSRRRPTPAGRPRPHSTATTTITPESTAAVEWIDAADRLAVHAIATGDLSWVESVPTLHDNAVRALTLGVPVGVAS